MLASRSSVGNVSCQFSISAKRRICIERTADMFLFAAAEVHSLSASSVTEGRPSPSAIRPIQHNLIYCLSLCFRLDSANEADSCLMKCSGDFDYLYGFF